MTPGQLVHATAAWREDRDRRDYRAGLVASVVIPIMLWFTKKGSKLPDPMSFFKPEKKQTPKDVARQACIVLGRPGGIPDELLS